MVRVRVTLLRSAAISLAIIVGWTVIGSFYFTQDLLFRQLRGGAAPIEEAGALTAIVTILWMLLTPLILFATQFVPIDRSRWFRALLMTVALVVVFALIRIGLGVAVIPLFDDRAPIWSDLVQGLTTRFHSNVTLAGIVVAARLLWDAVKSIREKERRALALQGQLARAQLEQLKGQLHPHFLFNALNGIATLIHTDPRRADQVLMELSALLRSSLDLETEDLIPLAEEIELTDRYLNIQKMRFDDRLTVRRSVDDTAMRCLVPPFVLQPLVENSLQHVIATRPRGGSIEIEARLTPEALRLSVLDDGDGFDPARVRYGVGITNVRDRLEQLYGENARLDFDRNDRGFRACITIPGSCE